ALSPTRRPLRRRGHPPRRGRHRTPGLARPATESRLHRPVVRARQFGLTSRPSCLIELKASTASIRHAHRATIGANSMSDHRITLNWQRNDATFERGNYLKDHEVRYLGGQTLAVSSAAAYGGNAALADPEQMLLSALASCHMLTFLAVAANRGYV